MNLPREDELAKTYQSASDNELLDLALTYDSLTEVAQNALCALSSRAADSNRQSFLIPPLKLSCFP
jgi:hypothetical protein